MAQQAASNVTAGFPPCGAADCKASGGSRVTLWQNVLHYIELGYLLQYGKTDCIALALVTTGHPLCRTMGHIRICGNLIGWVHLSITISARHMAIGDIPVTDVQSLCFDIVHGDDPVYLFSF